LQLMAQGAEVLDDGAEFGLVHLGDGCERAKGGVLDDLFDQFFLDRWFDLGLAEVAGGDVQAVEHDSGAAVVERVGGEAAEYLSEGVLDGALVLGRGEVECDGAGAAGTESVGVEGQAGGVVVVAELLVAQRRAGAAAAVGEDVAALVAFGFVILVGHRVPPSRGFCG
jgi:hypothetical protein